MNVSSLVSSKMLGVSEIGSPKPHESDTKGHCYTTSLNQDWDCSTFPIKLFYLKCGHKLNLFFIEKVLSPCKGGKHRIQKYRSLPLSLPPPLLQLDRVNHVKKKKKKREPAS